MTDLKPGVALLAKTLAEAAPATTTTLTLNGRDVLLTFGDWREGHAIRHAFAVGDQVAVLDLPRETMDWLLAPLPCPDDPIQRGMLLELACLDLLQSLDAHATDTDTPPVAFGVEIATDAGPLSLSLHLTAPLAQALNDHLARHAAPPDMAQVAVPVTVRMGQQFLTVDEAETLTHGDVILLESGPALLIAAGFAAAIQMTPTGPVMQSDLLPLPAATPHNGHVRFESAQTTMTLAALNALTNGQPLPLAVFEGAVDVLIEGRYAGRGQPVTIADSAGIRITHLAGPAA